MFMPALPGSNPKNDVACVKKCTWTKDLNLDQSKVLSDHSS
jgi:hypothetical protein